MQRGWWMRSRGAVTRTRRSYCCHTGWSVTYRTSATCVIACTCCQWRWGRWWRHRWGRRVCCDGRTGRQPTRCCASKGLSGAKTQQSLSSVSSTLKSAPVFAMPSQWPCTEEHGSRFRVAHLERCATSTNCCACASVWVTRCWHPEVLRQCVSAVAVSCFTNESATVSRTIAK